MVYFKDSRDYLHQSTLLVSARPTTTKITTRYTLSTPKRTRQRSREAAAVAPEESAHARVPKGTLTLKTYDPVSGVVLKYRTDRAAEVGRLMGGLSKCGHAMAAVAEKDVPVSGIRISQENEGSVTAAAQQQEASLQQGKAAGKKRRGKR